MLGIPVRAGRTFGETASDEVVVNETLARLLWPDGGPSAATAGADGGGGRASSASWPMPTRRTRRVGPMLFQPADGVAYLLFNAGEVAPTSSRRCDGVDSRRHATLQALGDNVVSSLASAALGARNRRWRRAVRPRDRAVGITACSRSRSPNAGARSDRLALGASRGSVRACSSAHERRDRDGLALVRAGDRGQPGIAQLPLRLSPSTAVLRHRRRSGGRHGVDGDGVPDSAAVSVDRRSRCGTSEPGPEPAPPPISPVVTCRCG